MAYLTGSRSEFPDKIDKIKEKYDLPPRKLQLAKRFQELKSKQDRTSAENEELNNLTIELQDFIRTPEDLNKAFDMVIATQKHYRDNTVNHINKLKQETNDYISEKKDEIQIFVHDKQVYIVNFVNGKVQLINNITAEGINTMNEKKDYFTAYVDTKQDEVRALVQEFDSNTARYYTTWTATKEGQTDFNIYQGSNINLPPEANLNIPVENVDLIINGVLQTPYIDYVIHNNGLYDTIRLSSNAKSLIKPGTEVVAKWYKNVGKLYFKHASSHGEGGTDELTVTKGMLDKDLQNQLMYIPVKSSIAPDPKKRKLWLDTSI